MAIGMMVGSFKRRLQVNPRDIEADLLSGFSHGKLFRCCEEADRISDKIYKYISWFKMLLNTRCIKLGKNGRKIQCTW